MLKERSGKLPDVVTGHHSFQESGNQSNFAGDKKGHSKDNMSVVVGAFGATMIILDSPDKNSLMFEKTDEDKSKDEVKKERRELLKGKLNQMTQIKSVLAA